MEALRRGVSGTIVNVWIVWQCLYSSVFDDEQCKVCCPLTSLHAPQSLFSPFCCTVGKLERSPEFVKVSTVDAFSINVTQICKYQRIQTNKLQYKKFGALEQLKNMHIAWVTFILPQDMAFQS